MTHIYSTIVYLGQASEHALASSPISGSPRWLQQRIQARLGSHLKGHHVTSCRFSSFWEAGWRAPAPS